MDELSTEGGTIGDDVETHFQWLRLLKFPYILSFNKQVGYTHANNDCIILFLH